MGERICVDLDRASQAALRILTMDGTSVEDAVRTALIEAAERLQARPVFEGPMEYFSYEEWLAAQVAAAPPPGPYQRYVVNAAFYEGRDTWLSKEEWLAEQEDQEGE